ncbi:unnamed protein product [Rotaria sordida]|uniref:PGAP2IP second transmembrane domain-containing protein n=1 Tax=Rotaria sordida TaxID=392033 RepID=A0A815K2M9_9BILA|nr:unnamed protein product [Rotaria sordida]CAF4166980.1 unnamed protein product [Rotaria sordida]
MWQLLPSISFYLSSTKSTLGINPLRSASCENILQPNWLLVDIGFGSLLFYLPQWVFGDLSVVSRWASNAFPNQPLDPIAYGLLIWFGLFCGIVIINRLSIGTNRWWVSVGFLASDLLYFSRGNVSFMSAFALSIFIGSILPLLFYKIARALSAHIVFIAIFPYIIQRYLCLFFYFLGIYFQVYTDRKKISTNILLL